VKTLHALKIANPDDFYRLPEGWQRKHLAFVRDEIQGRHLPPAKTKSPPRPTARMARAAEEWRATRLRPPSAAEIGQARRVLRLSNLPDALAQAARQTLLRAGLEA
jgi:hypothetical protein